LQVFVKITRQNSGAFSCALDKEVFEKKLTIVAVERGAAGKADNLPDKRARHDLGHSSV